MISDELSAKEVVERGKRLYDERLRQDMERDHVGDFIVIDVRSGDYEVARKDVDASLRLLDRRPDALIYGVRIGDEVAYRFGHSRYGGYWRRRRSRKG